jgi:hypothetical protein
MKLSISFMFELKITVFENMEKTQKYEKYTLQSNEILGDLVRAP